MCSTRSSACRSLKATHTFHSGVVANTLERHQQEDESVVPPPSPPFLLVKQCSGFLFFFRSFREMQRTNVKLWLQQSTNSSFPWDHLSLYRRLGVSLLLSLFMCIIMLTSIKESTISNASLRIRAFASRKKKVNGKKPLRKPSAVWHAHSSKGLDRRAHQAKDCIRCLRRQTGK